VLGSLSEADNAVQRHGYGPVGPGHTLMWSHSSESGFDPGFGGLSSEVQSTITVTLQGP
jgi:hypothetical protein